MTASDHGSFCKLDVRCRLGFRGVGLIEAMRVLKSFPNMSLITSLRTYHYYG